jgi:hypothetical protein
VHVAIVGRDVEVADEQELRVERELCREQRAERREPLELVSILVRIDALAVRHVQAPQPQIADRDAENAFLLVDVAAADL